jgi:hypothetical protein
MHKLKTCTIPFKTIASGTHSLNWCLGTQTHTGLPSCLNVQLRHPNILAFKDSAEIQEKGATVIYMVTQPVRSLKTVLEELDLQGQHR